ncbi:MAG: hypothetical protein P8R42_05770 [Candidatus Binatia bacterium]|nr:hypothetical protein [Candidatus Binatia bacterium]
MFSLTREELRQTAAYTAILVILAAVVVANIRYFGEGDQQQDIYFSFVEGQRIVAGENPYARVLEGDFRQNDKYATYFPLFYELSALTQWAGLRAYGDWLAFWRVIFGLFDVGITLLLFETCRRRGAWLLGVFAAGLWGLGRWSLFIVLIGHLDFLPIFFLLLSLLLLRERPTAAFLLYGLSLSLKQIGIFVAPLYLIWAWQLSPKKDVRGVVRAGLLIALIPIATSLPFLLWNAPGFFGSVLFSATRNARTHFSAYSVDAALGLSGPLARLPMLALLAGVYALAATRAIGVYTSCLLTFVVFVDFNTVLYTHYPAWVVPFIPTAALDGASDSVP